jgi:hypothetical protein
VQQTGLFADLRRVVPNWSHGPLPGFIPARAWAGMKSGRRTGIQRRREPPTGLAEPENGCLPY